MPIGNPAGQPRNRLLPSQRVYRPRETVLYEPPAAEQQQPDQVRQRMALERQ